MTINPATARLIPLGCVDGGEHTLAPVEGFGFGVQHACTVPGCDAPRFLVLDSGTLLPVLDTDATVAVTS